MRLGLPQNKLTRAGVRAAFGMTAEQLRAFESAGVVKFADGQIDAGHLAYDVYQQALMMASRAELRSLEVAKFARLIASCAAIMGETAATAAETVEGAREMKRGMAMHAATMLQMYEAAVEEWLSGEEPPPLEARR